MMKARLYSSASGWNSRHASVMAALGLPDGGTLRYAEIRQVDNEEHDDHEKYVFPVLVSGTYKCDQLFTANDLVNWDETWFAQATP